MFFPFHALYAWLRVCWRQKGPLKTEIQMLFQTRGQRVIKTVRKAYVSKGTKFPQLVATNTINSKINKYTIHNKRK